MGNEVAVGYRFFLGNHKGYPYGFLKFWVKILVIFNIFVLKCTIK